MLLKIVRKINCHSLACRSSIVKCMYRKPVLMLLKGPIREKRHFVCNFPSFIRSHTGTPRHRAAAVEHIQRSHWYQESPFELSSPILGQIELYLSLFLYRNYGTG